MLHLNREGSADLTLASKTEEIVWKVLVLDSKSQKIISSVLRVNDLLRCGITIHALIDAKRSPLPDVAAIYFVEPKIENILSIMDDVVNDKYESFYINFTSSINRELLEEFAKRVSLSGKSYKVKQVYDQYLDFVVTEPNLFSLGMDRVFTTFSNPHTAEDDIHKLAERIANGLLTTLITINKIPIIRCPRNGPAELVATQLDLKVRDFLNNSGISHSQQIQQRPVLILLDRNIDLASMFSHSWIYQCMVSDVFTLKRNTIKLVKYDDNQKATSKSYDIDPKDFFWARNSQLPFPDVVEHADIELNAYKKAAQELTNKTGITSLSDIDPNKPDMDTRNIQQAVDNLPKLTARKATLDMHMDVLATLLKELEAKNLDKFFEIEQNYANPNVRTEFLQILSEDSKRDNSEDKLRTFLCLVLLLDLPGSFINECKEVFYKRYPQLNLASLKYIQNFKQTMKLSNVASFNIQASGGFNQDSSVTKNNTALFNGLSSKLYGLTEGRITEGLSSFASGLKKLLPDKKQLPITNIVEAIIDPANASNNSIQLTDDYLYLDPKLRGGHSKPPRRLSYQETEVFVIGGASYLEYQNLQEWNHSRKQDDRKIIYGGTDVLTPNEFLEECTILGNL